MDISEILYPLFFVVTPQISTRKEVHMSGAFCSSVMFTVSPLFMVLIQKQREEKHG